jgi:hypothetical protein
MVRVAVIVTIVLSAFLGCKSSKTVYVSPHTDTIKIVTSYSADTIEVFVKKIILSDSLFNIKENAPGFTIIDATQNDSLLFLTIKSYNSCTKMDFDLYQSSFVFKSYPPRLRMRLAKIKESKCDSTALSQMQVFTEVFDIRPLLKQYKQASITFTGSRAVAAIKQ